MLPLYASAFMLPPLCFRLYASALCFATPLCFPPSPLPQLMCGCADSDLCYVSRREGNRVLGDRFSGSQSGCWFFGLLLIVVYRFRGEPWRPRSAHPENGTVLIFLPKGETESLLTMGPEKGPSLICSLPLHVEPEYQ